MAGHALVVGGTGMLAGAVDALAAQGWRVSLISRHAGAFAEGREGVQGYDADYTDTAGFGVALDAATDHSGAPALAVAWFRILKIEAPRLLAQRMAEGGRLFQVLGSAMADPDHPDRLARAAAVCHGAGCRLRQVVLGFVVEGERARWLTHQEISQGVMRAVAEDHPLSIIGEVQPWRLRPAT